MMKRKMVILFATSVLTASMLSACGTSTKQTDNSSATATTSSNSKPSTSNTTSTASSNSTASTGKTVDVKVIAKDFEYDKKEIHVKKGDKVKITLASDDGGHGFEIPDYKVNIQGNGSAEFTADKAGTFEYHCSVMCGTGHSKMTGKFIVG
jgi:cytochrome c oxidase subunit II